MSISRRKFIKIGSISVAMLAGMSLGTEAAVSRRADFSDNVGLPREIYGDPLFSYHADTFKNLIGTQFSLQTKDFAETVVLTAVKENSFNRRNSLKGKTITPSENFMLSFRILSAEAGQATYTMFHPKLGTFDLLLVPAINDQGENLLNAVINRL